MNRGGNAAGGRFGTRALPPSNIMGTRPNPVPNNGRTDSGRTFNTGNNPATRAEPYHEEHVAVPAVDSADSSTKPRMVNMVPPQKTDVTKIETVVEKVYVLDEQTFKINESISNIQTEVAAPNRSAFARGLFQSQMSNNTKSNNGINEAGANPLSKQPIEGATKDIGIGEQSNQTGGGAKDIGTNGWSNPTKGSTNSISSDGLTRPTAAGGGGGGTDTGSKGWSKPTDNTANDITPNSGRMPTAETANGAVTNENRPTDGITNTGTSGTNDRCANGANTWSGQPGAGINEAGANSSSKPPIEDIGVGGAGGWRGVPSVPPPIKPITIDSKEAALKYNGYIAPPPIKPKILDSNEAARKYKGFLEPPPTKLKTIDSNEAALKYKGYIPRTFRKT